MHREAHPWEHEAMTAARISLLVGVTIALASCSNTSASSAVGSCDAARTEAEPVLGVEAQANSNDGHEVWALFFNTWPLPPGEAVRIPVNEEVKIVWRSTGDGSFTIHAEGPEGESIEPAWGPDPHGSSNWERPGKEWGTGWVFPSTGCWTFDVSHGDQAAEMVAEVFASTDATANDQ
jgi:hypothetical protein